MIRVLFVCTGNICRSPMAEAVFTQMVSDQGLAGQIEADSAGTINYHSGEAAHPGTLRILQEHGIGYTGRARPVNDADLTRFDYLIAMDNTHIWFLDTLSNKTQSTESAGHLARLLDYAPAQPIRDVPDPYDTGRFAEVYALIYQGCAGLLEAIRAEQYL